MPRLLSAQQLERWHEDGFLVLPGFKSAEKVAAVARRAREIAGSFDPGAHLSAFSSREQAHPRRQAADRAFLASARGIHCFVEEEALDEHGRLRVAPEQALNKIGHALHDLDPVFDDFSRDPALAALACDLGLQAPRLWQSMLIFKQPGIGGEVRWHQDATFLHSTPLTVTGLWFALEDATRDNGCLWAQPGGHRGALRERFEREGDDESPRLTLRTLDRSPWPTLQEAVPLEAAAGTLVCLHGLLPHFSAPNRSPHSRLAYTLHLLDASSRYSPTNWLRDDPACPVRGFEAASAPTYTPTSTPTSTPAGTTGPARR